MNKEIKTLAKQINLKINKDGWSIEAHTLIIALLDMIKKEK